ncbi:MAG: STAS-like domain-containing protein [Nitrospira sp.]|nr:STAS-like domain-containing protein [Nitrospira sp.]
MGKVTGDSPQPEFDLECQGDSVRIRLLRPDFIARSEARRLLANLENVREIVVDFRDVRSVGQGFSDEVFRVFANRHSGIVIHPEHASPAVLAMIKHVRPTAPRETPAH